MEQISVYDSEVYQEMIDRINTLTAESTPEWGTMSVGQMLSHCAEVQEVFCGEKTLQNTPLLARLIKGLIRRGALGDRPYSRGLRTHRQYRQSEAKDFDREKRRLLDGLERFVTMDEAAAARIEHPLFGRMSREERGWGIYKHLDHHLRQFGV
jgi:hypothetical protein